MPPAMLPFAIANGMNPSSQASRSALVSTGVAGAAVVAGTAGTAAAAACDSAVLGAGGTWAIATAERSEADRKDANEDRTRMAYPQGSYPDEAMVVLIGE